MHGRLLAIFLLLPWLLLGQQEYQFSTANGLPSNTVYDIVQDSAGFIWIATSKGVVKYDGTSFKTFTVKDGLPNNDTWKLEVTPNGNVWYVSKSNRQGFIANDSVYSFPIENNKTISPRSFGIENNNLVLYGGGTFDLQQGVWKRTPPAKIGERPKLALHINDSIIMNNEQSHVEIYQLKNAVLKKLQRIETTSSFDSLSIHMISYGVYNNVIWQQLEDVLLLVDFEHSKHRIISHKNNTSQRPFVWANERTIQWKVDNQLIIFNHAFETVETITHNDLRAYHRAIKDSDGNLWMTSLSKGIKMIPAISLTTSHHFENKKVHALRLANDTLYVGVRNEPLYYKLQEKVFPTKLKAEGNIYDIKLTEYYGTYVLGASHASAKKNTLLRSDVFEDERALPSSKREQPLGLIDLYETRNTHYLLTHDHVFARTVGDSYFEPLSPFNGGIAITPYQDRLLLLASDGLHLIQEDTLVPFPKQDRHRPIPYLIATSYKDKLLLGTDGFGVHVLQGESIIPIPATKGLSVNRIIERDDHLWLATQNGVQVLKLQADIQSSEIVDSYYQADGILDRNINDIALRDSLLFVATDLGFSELNLKNRNYGKEPSLYFETHTDSLVFPYKDAEALSIAFNTLTYTNQANLKYYYRLSPEQQTWQSVKNQELTFANLAPGAYNLEIQVVDQHKNTSSRRLPLTILPLWYQTLWFRLLLVLITFLSLIGIGYFFYRQIKSREQLKSARKQKISSLELQALRSQMNPHFVHNSLNAIQYFVQRNEVALSEKYLSQFSRLIRQFFEHSRTQSITLSEEIELLKNYLDIEKMRFEEKMEYRITVDPTLETNQIKIPSMMLQPLVENAINHGIFHKETQGTVTLNFKKESEHLLTIVIEDDGIGINEAKKLNVNFGKDPTSNSSHVLSERIALLQQEKRWNIHFSVEDLNKYPQKTGTRVIITLAI